MKWLWLVVLLLPLAAVQAAGPAQTSPVVDAVEQLPRALQDRYDNLLAELRCVVCQNETLKASQAPLAADLRAEVRQMMLSGKSNTQIKHYLVARYGEFVLYRPRFEVKTWALWLGPGIILLLAITMVLRLLRRRRVPVAPPDTKALAHALARSQPRDPPA